MLEPVATSDLGLGGAYARQPPRREPVLRWAPIPWVVTSEEPRGQAEARRHEKAKTERTVRMMQPHLEARRAVEAGPQIRRGCSRAGQVERPVFRASDLEGNRNRRYYRTWTDLCHGPNIGTGLLAVRGVCRKERPTHGTTARFGEIGSDLPLSDAIVWTCGLAVHGCRVGRAN